MDEFHVLDDFFVDIEAGEIAHEASDFEVTGEKAAAAIAEQIERGADEAAHGFGLIPGSFAG